MTAPVYLDYNSTTPVDSRVLEFMLPYFSQQFGNAASRTHVFGWAAAQVVDEARLKVAALINAAADEIVFTSGSTEAINLALKGVFEAYHSKGKHIITAVTEHKAVLDTCLALEEAGAEITFLPVDREGRIDPAGLRKAMRKDTILVAVMLANNETGVIQPIRDLSDLAHEAGALFFSDTTQAAGKIRIDVKEMGIDLCCLSAHKFYGPKGTGALYVRKKNPRVSLISQMHGGGHENDLRSGTLNVPGIAGFGKAAELAAQEWWNDGQRISAFRTRLEQELEVCAGIRINGSIRDRLPNTSNIMLPGIKADQLIRRAPLLALATGSACTSAIPEPSHVLKAMGLSAEEAYSSVRISLGRMTTGDEIDYTVKELCNVLQSLRY
jgi:cysteine desulfurase